MPRQRAVGASRALDCVTTGLKPHSLVLSKSRRASGCDRREGRGRYDAIYRNLGRRQ